MIFDIVQSFFLTLGLSHPQILHSISLLSSFTLVLAFGFLVFFIAKKLFFHKITTLVLNTSNDWDNIFLKNQVFQKIFHILPIITIYLTWNFFGKTKPWINQFLAAYLIIVVNFLINSILNSFVQIYSKFPISKQKPIVGYVQVLKVFVYLFAAIFLISVITDHSPWALLTSLGAVTAILLLLFKDMIYGLVASFQITANKLVSIGDWICFDHYGADGNVIEIALLSVKIQNWDNTIVSVPTYAFISNSFQNYRGMVQSKGRRIKCSIHIDMNSIRFCSHSMICRFQSIPAIQKYLLSLKNVQTTNLTLFRVYLFSYLENHPDIHKNMTFMVRNLNPSHHGLPLEIYAFSQNINWIPYEKIQSSILDYVIASLPFFNLKIYQFPSELKS